MPKENTHILLVNMIIDTFPGEAAREMMRANYEPLCFGSIVADTFFYSSNRDVVKISDKIHGKQGEKTNELIFYLLDRARSARSDALLSFALGYISHCVLDMIFHPVIYFLAGNYYDNDPAKRESAVYRHRLIETWLDNDVNRRYHLHEILRKDDTRHHEILGIIAERYGADPNELIKAYKKQIWGNGCFKSPITYRLICLLHKLRIINAGQLLPLFYSHIETDPPELPQTIDILDIVDGRSRRVVIPDMFDMARTEAIKRIEAAVSYYDGKMDRAVAMEVIRGESLDTGREGCPVSSIHHAG